MAELGSSVLLDVNNGERFTFARLNPSTTLKLGKTKYSLECMIGCPFGSVFETKGSSLQRCSRAESVENAAAEEEEDPTTTKDNRNLVDDNTAQGLSADEIHNMKRDGSSGQEIVNALIANSVSYQTKTAFSQEKYKRKKQKKYAPRIIVRRPTARSVCEAYFAKTPTKTGFLRVDALSMILSLANVGEKSNVLVLDMFGGLLTAAVAERLSGFGTVCSVHYTNKAPSLDIVNLFNFDSATTSKIYKTSVSKLLEIRSSSTKAAAASGGADTDTPTFAEGGGENLEASNTSQRDEDVNHPPAEAKMDVDEEKPVEKPEEEAEPSMDVDEAPENQQNPAAAVTDPTPQKKSRAIPQPSDEELSLWLKDGFTSLIVGTLSSDTTKVVEDLLPLISPSSPFVVYHTYLQPLAECMFLLQKDRRAVNLQLSEPWVREYQVLPARTHPHMQMSSTGGYFLSGIRVCQQ